MSMTNERHGMTTRDAIDLIKRHIAIIIAIPVTLTAVVAVYAYRVLPDQYTATTSMYVMAQDDATSANTLQSDLNASQMLTNDVATLLDSDRISEVVASDMGIDNLKGYDVNVTSKNTSRVITLSVTGQDAKTATNIANDMVRRVSETAQNVMGVESVNAIDEAKVPTTPSGPRRALFVLIAFVAGLILSVAGVFVSDTMNTKVKGQDDLSEIGLPVIGRIPEAK